MKSLAENKDFKNRFLSNPMYNSNGSQFPVSAFISILQQLYVKKIDYTFLTKYYEDHSKNFVNAINFVNDTIRYENTQIG